MGKKSGSKRNKYRPLDEFMFGISSKRNEIEASNHRNSKKDDDVIKNQVEDKSECNKLLTEGIRLNINNKTKKKNLLKNSLDYNKKNDDFDESTKKQNKLDVSKSICKTSADANRSNIDMHKKQNHDTRLEESKCDRDSKSKKIENQNKSYCENDLLSTSSKQQLNEELAEENNSKRSNKNKKKKEKHIRDQQKEDNFNSNKNIELDCNKHDRTSSIDRKRDKCVRSEKKSRFTDNTDGQHSFTMGCHYKGRSIMNDICQSSTSKDEMCNIEEIDQDLFELPNDVSLAHCVAQDLRMGAGIAVKFKHVFGGVGSLIDQKLKVGNVGRVNRHNRNVFYLITKKYSNGKPTMASMEQALCSLLIEMNKLNIKKLGIPKIGCGLDGLDWDNVKLLIKHIFAGSGIQIIVCIPSKILDWWKAPQPLNVHITPKNLWEMQSETLIIIPPINLEKVQNQILTNDVIDKVNARYPFKNNLMKDLKNMKLKPGDIKLYCVKNENIVCVFYQQSVYYSSLEKAFTEICLRFIKYYIYFAIQSGPTKNNLEHLAWIVLILRSICHNGELWLCGDTEQTDTVHYDQYCRDLRNPEKRLSNYYTSQPIYTHYNGSYNK